MLPLITRISTGILTVMITCDKVRKLVEPNSDLTEIIKQYEKYRRNAVPPSERTVSGYSVHEDTEQESSSIPNTRRILFVQTRIHAKSNNTDS